MGYDNLAKLTKTRPSIVDILSETVRSELIALDKQGRDKLFDRLTASLNTGNSDADRWFLMMILADQDYAIATVRKRGVFRRSNYPTQNNAVTNVVRQALKYSDKLALSEGNKAYLRSVNNLRLVGQCMTTLLDELLSKLRELERSLTLGGWRYSVITSLLTYVELQFCDTSWTRSSHRLNGLDYYSKEEIAEAVSFLIYLVDKEIGIGTGVVPRIDVDLVHSPTMRALLLAACIYKKLQEAEVLIDHFGYSCDLRNNEIVIHEGTSGLERSIRLGYSKTFLQKLYYVHDRDEFPEEVPSFEAMAESLLEIGGLRVKGEGVDRRLTMEIPLRLWEVLYGCEGLFREEVESLELICREQLITVDDLTKLELAHGFSIFDYFRVKRLFSFMYYFYTRRVLEQSGDDDRLATNSVLPVISHQVLRDHLREVAGEKGLSYLDYACWESNKDKVLDIQYQPLVSINGHYHAPFALIHHSDAVRNARALANRLAISGMQSDGRQDALVNILRQTLEKRGFMVVTQRNFTYMGQKSDMDIVAYRDGMLFVFECKNSQLPCNIFELRSTYDEVIVGCRQLELAEQALRDSSFSDPFMKQLGIKGTPAVAVCVVLTNRVLSGSQSFRYPIRGIHELVSYIQTGCVKDGSGEHCFWKGKEFAPTDLFEYLDDAKSVATMLNEAMQPVDLILPYGDRRIVFETFALDQVSAKSLFQKALACRGEHQRCRPLT